MDDLRAAQPDDPDGAAAMSAPEAPDERVLFDRSHVAQTIALAKSPNVGSIDLFRFLVAQAPLRMAAIVACGIAGAIVSVAVIALVNDMLASHAVREALPGYVTLCAISIAAQAISQTLLGRVAQGAVGDLRRALCTRVLAMPLRDIERYGSAKLIGLLSADVGVIATALLNAPLAIIDAVVMLSCIAYLGWLAPSMFLPVFGCAVVGIALHWSVAQRANAAYSRLAAQEAELHRYFGDLAGGVKELKLSAARRDLFFGGTLQPAIEACREELLTGRAYFIGALALGQLLLFALIGVVLGYTAMAGESRTATAYVLMLLYMMIPFTALLNFAPLMMHASACWNKIRSFTAHAPASAQEAESAPEGPLLKDWRVLELIGVTFSYDSADRHERFRVGPIDLTINRGEVLFVIGGNGSGKTTLTKVLTHLYEPESGEIRVDGVPVAAADVQRYRESFAAVFSDFHLFAALTGEAATLDARAHELLHKLHLSDVLTVNAGTLSTLALSQGQRKRLALLTAYLQDRPVYLFDEWAADQDPEFRAVFYRELLRDIKVAGKTAIVISHDDRFFDCADRIVKLEYGRVVPASSALELESVGTYDG